LKLELICCDTHPVEVIFILSLKIIVNLFVSRQN